MTIWQVVGFLSAIYEGNKKMRLSLTASFELGCVFLRLFCYYNSLCG